MKFLKNDSETILSKDYSKSFLDDIGGRWLMDVITHPV